MNANQTAVKQVLKAYQTGLMTLDAVETIIRAITAAEHYKSCHEKIMAEESMDEAFAEIRENLETANHTRLSLTSSASFIIYFEDYDENE